MDVFSLDNTNAIEGNFSGVKKRMAISPLTLRDVFNAVDMTERTILASGSPFAPTLPLTIKNCFLLIFSADVLNVMSLVGIQQLLDMMITLTTNILNDCALVMNRAEAFVNAAIVDGVKIQTFRWMPQEWVVPLSNDPPNHIISHISIANSSIDFDILMRLQPFFEISHRSVSVFSTLNNALMNLYTLEERTLLESVIPVNYTFFFNEFAHFAKLSQTNDEILETLLELCRDLELERDRCDIKTAPKKSIVDPGYKKVRGHKATSTSARVDHAAVQPRTKMIDDYQVNELHREKKPTRKRRKQHTCPVCRKEGHHARTCHEVLLDENAERADLFFKQLADANKVDAYVTSLGKRETQAFVERVIGRIEAVSRKIA